MRFFFLVDDGCGLFQRPVDQIVSGARIQAFPVQNNFR